MAHATHSDSGDIRRMFAAMLMTGSFMVVEVVGGILTGSLALLAEAGHMLTDTAALALAWLAFRMARRPSDQRRSYGYHRFQVLAAFVNGIALIMLVGWILIEALQRLAKPVTILGGPMLLIAALGMLVNITVLYMLRQGDRDNMNIRGAALHVVGDLLGSVAAIVAAVVIIGTGWTPVDPLLSMFVAILIFRSAWILVKKSAHILLEGAPEWLDANQVRAQLQQAVPAVEDVHHVHVWSLTSQRPLITLHARVAAGTDHVQVLNAIKGVLTTKFGLSHSTVQIEPEDCVD